MSDETSVITDLKRSEQEDGNGNTSNLSENDASPVEEANNSLPEANDKSNLNEEDGLKSSLDKIEFIRV